MPNLQKVNQVVIDTFNLFLVEQYKMPLLILIVSCDD